MPFLKTKCPVCDKTAETATEFKIGSKIVSRLKCGHLMDQQTIEQRSAENIISLDGKKLYKFQCDGVRFIEQSGARALVGDEMGLGKTVQYLAFLALHPEELPALFVVKSTLKIQLQHEILRWCGIDSLSQIISSSSDEFIPGIKYYIISYDLLARITNKRENGKHKNKGKGKKETLYSVETYFESLESEEEESKASREAETLNQTLKKLRIRTIIIDECQQIKNPDSARARELRLMCMGIPNVIAASGTPIKNSANEFFSILNIIKPEMFPNYTRFVQFECDSYWNGFTYKTGGLKYPEQFKKKTANFIIRRERNEVLPDLPNITRNFQLCDLGDVVEKAYLDTFKQFRDDYNSGNCGTNGYANEGFGGVKELNTLAYLSKMRHLTGWAKIDPCIDFCMEFLGGCNRKLTIFVHHKDVAEALKNKLTNLCQEFGLLNPLSLTSDLSQESRANVVNTFMEGNGTSPRILIASTLASGEGLNLQKCSDCIMLERQWNPANEEQAEGRFIRIGQLSDKITATYFVAVGTVDEFFAEIVERKREIVTGTLGGKSVAWDQSSIIKELAETLAAVGGRKWGI